MGKNRSVIGYSDQLQINISIQCKDIPKEVMETTFLLNRLYDEVLEGLGILSTLELFLSWLLYPTMLVGRAMLGDHL